MIAALVHPVAQTAPVMVPVLAGSGHWTPSARRKPVPEIPIISLISVMETASAWTPEQNLVHHTNAAATVVPQTALPALTAWWAITVAPVFVFPRRPMVTLVAARPNVSLDSASTGFVVTVPAVALARAATSPASRGNALTILTMSTPMASVEPARFATVPRLARPLQTGTTRRMNAHHSTPIPAVPMEAVTEPVPAASGVLLPPVVMRFAPAPPCSP
jgi:hypothetical protein